MQLYTYICTAQILHRKGEAPNKCNAVVRQNIDSRTADLGNHSKCRRKLRHAHTPPLITCICTIDSAARGARCNS